jgi:hypothetical protein
MGNKSLFCTGKAKSQFEKSRAGSVSGARWVHGAFQPPSTPRFYPEEVEILVAAFDDAWAKLQASEAPFVAEGYVLGAREILARRIIMAAKRGERNPRQLTNDALLYLSQQKLSKKPPA